MFEKNAITERISKVLGRPARAVRVGGWVRKNHPASGQWEAVTLTRCYAWLDDDGRCQHGQQTVFVARKDSANDSDGKLHAKRDAAFAYLDKGDASEILIIQELDAVERAELSERFPVIGELLRKPCYAG